MLYYKNHLKKKIKIRILFKRVERESKKKMDNFRMVNDTMDSLIDAN